MKNKISFKLKAPLSLIIAFLMTATLTATSVFVSYAETADTVFTDVSTDDWFYGDVQYVYDYGIMNGVDTDKFAPNSPLSRAMGVTILHRAAGEPFSLTYRDPVNGRIVPFKDVKFFQWYGTPVKWAAANAIVNGREEDMFVPDDYITRAEFATILLRYTKYAHLNLPDTKDGDFSDADQVPDYAKEAVDALYKAEIINGKENSRFDPSASITRAEAAAMIRRFTEKSEKIPDDEILTVLFQGSSYTFEGDTPLHFKRLSENQIDVSFWSIYDAGFDPAPIKDKVDIVIMNEGYEAPFLYNIFGADKSYYGFELHLGPWDAETAVGIVNDRTIDAHGNKKHNDLYIDRSAELNDFFKMEMDMLADVNGGYIGLGGVVPYNSELQLEDFFVNDFEIHPKQIMGYCIALAMYCKIFDVKATDQNNGALLPMDIPGETKEEKDAYMVMVKETVQHILDIQ